jgi:tight adherence protein B
LEISMDPQFFALFAAMTAMLATLSLTAGVGVIRDWRSRRSVQEALSELDSISLEVPGGYPVLRADDGESLLQRLLSRFPRVGDVEDLLMKSGLRWSLERFILFTCFSSITLGLPIWLVSRAALVSLVALVVGFWLPNLYVRFKANRRIRALESQLPGAIDHLTRAVRAGHPFSAGLKMLAEESDEPIASEFRAVFEEQRFGLPFEEALLGFGDRVDLPDVRILITAILVQKEVGGNLAEILEKVAGTMRARFTIRRQVRVFTVQGRMSGYILAALPVVVGLFILLINRDYMEPLFIHPVGKWALGLALVLQLIGFLWIRKIVNVEY